MNNMLSERKNLYESFIKDLEKLPVKVATFHNYDRDVTQVVEADRVSRLIRKYARKSLRIKK